MSAGYAIFNIEVTNPDPYKEYIQKVKPIAEKFGGEYVVRGGNNQVVEGSWQYSRNVVIKFPSYEKALECHNSSEYKSGWDLAKKTTKRHMQVIEGFSIE